MAVGGRQISLKDKMRKSRPPETKTKRQHAHHVRLSPAFRSVRPVFLSKGLRRDVFSLLGKPRAQGFLTATIPRSVERYQNGGGGTRHVEGRQTRPVISYFLLRAK